MWFTMPLAGEPGFAARRCPAAGATRRDPGEPMTFSTNHPSANRVHILIVEDHPLVAKFYRLALERAGGFACLVTENVEEMLAEVKAGRVDLAILDVSLSGTEWQGRQIDGVELAHLLRSSAPGRLPILLPPPMPWRATANVFWPPPAPTIIWKSPSTMPACSLKKSSACWDKLHPFRKTLLRRIPFFFQAESAVNPAAELRSVRIVDSGGSRAPAPTIL